MDVTGSSTTAAAAAEYGAESMELGTTSGHGGLIHIGTGLGLAYQDTAGDLGYITATCAECGLKVSFAVLATTAQQARAGTRWLRCLQCGHGAVMDGDGKVSPASSAGEKVDHLPPEIGKLYAEARAALGFGAPTGCEMLCRSVLGHTAHHLKWKKGTFADALDYLITEGYITTPMKPWVDRIRLHGNEVAHEAVLIDEERAADTLRFTTQLLRVVFETPGIASLYEEPPKS